MTAPSDRRINRRTLLAGLVGAALNGVARRAAGAQTMRDLRVVGPANDGFKALFYGVRAGIFKRYGLNVVTTMTPNGAAAAAALSGGSADVAYTNTLTLIQAHAHNVPMVYVAPGNLVTPGKRASTLTLVLRNSPIRSGRDLNGKILGSSSLRDINAAATLAWIDKTGGDSSTVRVVEVPASAGAAFLQEHRADAVTLNEPAASEAVASGNVRVLTQPYDAIGGGMTAGFAAMSATNDATRDTFSRFARAMHEASVYTNAHLAETVPLVASYSGVEPDVIAKGARFIDAEYLEPRSLQSLIDLCARYGLIDKAFPAAEVIDPAALKPLR